MIFVSRLAALVSQKLDKVDIHNSSVIFHNKYPLISRFIILLVLIMDDRSNLNNKSVNQFYSNWFLIEMEKKKLHANMLNMKYIELSH